MMDERKVLQLMTEKENQIAEATVEERIKMRTEDLLKLVKECLRQAYLIEALKANEDEDNDASSVRLIKTLKDARGILNGRLKDPNHYINRQGKLHPSYNPKDTVEVDWSAFKKL